MTNAPAGAQPAPEQRAASDPSISAWVRASAGSGKTSVLRDRVLRLLLAGVDPANILCLTFTKTAAAEMAQRITDTLAAWTAMDEGSLRAALSALNGRQNHEADLKQAPRLFARLLEVPGGMKIQTIHSFCQSLLRRFPLEAGILPHANPMTDTEANVLKERAWHMLLQEIARGGDAADAFAIADSTVEGRGIHPILDTIMAKRPSMRVLARRQASLATIRAAYSHLLGVTSDKTVEQEILDACRDEALAFDDLRAAAQAMEQAQNGDQKKGRVMAEWLARNPERRVALWSTYCGAFLTQEGTILKRLATEPTKKLMGNIEKVRKEEAERLLSVRSRVNCLLQRDQSAALLFLALRHFALYQDLKRREAKLDYDDLIEHARDLLRQPDIAPWILYKLDGHIQHIMIDEAQDTNDRQWDIVTQLSEEFFAGETAETATRTIFAVGDEKQAIFGFQGSDPEHFLAAEQRFSERAGARFRSILLNRSYRAAKPLLEIVDRTLSGEPGFAGGHIAHHAGLPGEVHCWPLAVGSAGQDEKPSPWDPHFHEREGEDAARLLAFRVAQEVETLMERGFRPGDILILVEARNKFLTALVRALKSRDIPLAGRDRWRLTDDIAILDLLAFGKFLLLPEDDLNLAALLRSPLFGITEEELRRLAQGRGRQSLWHRLGKSDSDSCRHAHERLSGFLGRVDFMAPYELFQDLLRNQDGRRALLGRLGPECADSIDEFLARAIEYESQAPASLQGFVSWLEKGESEIKRDQENATPDALRIMTIHGAKGLEAPVVFLVDYVTKEKPLEEICWVSSVPAGPTRMQSTETVAFPLWAPKEAEGCHAANGARQEMRARLRRERDRLLYVGMTRAAQILYLCAWSAKRSASSSWHHRWQLLFGETETMEELDFTGPGWLGRAFRYPRDTVVKPAPREESTRSASPMPACFDEPAPGEARPTTLAPSQMISRPGRSISGRANMARAERGIRIHRLLELLPAEPETLERLLARYPADQAAEIRDHLTRALADDALKPFLGPHSLAEVPIQARIGERILEGRIDRLVITETELLVLDVKTGTRSPHTAALDPYVIQMAYYRTALRPLAEDRPIRCFLYWTEQGLLEEIPQAALDRAPA